MREQKHVVSENEHGMTLLAFLKATHPGDVSVKDLKRFIESKGCRVNGRVVVFSSQKLMKGDLVEHELFLKEPFEKKKCQIIYEDADLIVIDKPSGVVSEPSSISSIMGIKGGVYLIHRLDKDTSGLLMLAKNELFFSAMKDLFSEKMVEKFYLAFVDGKMGREGGAIDTFLVEKGRYSGQTIFASGAPGQGQRAITHFQVLKRGDRTSFVLLEPKTGRTHQLRVHMKEMGHPIVGDFQYAQKFICPFKASRHLLHAYALSFIHPKTKRELFFTAPLPKDFQEFAHKAKVNLNDVADLTSLQAIAKRLQR